MQVAGLCFRRGDIVHRDRGRRNEIAGDLAQVETVRTDKVHVRACLHVCKTEESGVGSCGRADDVAGGRIGVRAGNS